MTPRTCPALAVAEQLDAWIGVWRDRDEATARAAREHRPRDAADAARDMELAFARIEALEVELSWQRAETLEGALAQLTACASFVRDVVDFDLTAAELERRGEAALRVLYSVRAAVARAAGEADTGRLGEHYLPARCSPFRLLAEAA